MIDKKTFYDSVRGWLFNGNMSKSQVEGLENLLDVWFTDYHHRFEKSVSLRMLAYMLATAYHETSRTMQPVRETLATTDKQAIDRLDRAWARGKLGSVRTPYWRDGFFGRGYVQLTHRRNYEKASAKLKVDFVSNPSLAMDRTYAAHILFRGSIEGWFTSLRLSDYIKPTTTSYVSARAIINGRDRATHVAGYAQYFEKALMKSYNGVAITPSSATPAAPPEKQDSWITVLINAIMGIFRR